MVGKADVFATITASVNVNLNEWQRLNVPTAFYFQKFIILLSLLYLEFMKINVLYISQKIFMFLTNKRTLKIENIKHYLQQLFSFKVYLFPI